MRGADDSRRRQALGLVVLGIGATVLGGERAGDASPNVVGPSSSHPIVAATGTAAPLPALTPPSPLDDAARRPATEVQLAPSKDGRLGAWLVIGPYRPRGGRGTGASAMSQSPEGIDERTIAPRLGGEWAANPPFTKTPPKWQIAATNEGALDVAGALKTKDNDLIAYAAGTLHVESPGRYHLLLGSDDGVRVILDGRPVFTRDEARPQRADDDLVPLDLSAGDHLIVLKLHQRDSAWAFQVRFLDANFLPPAGAYLALPGSTADEARDLASRMSWISIDRGMHGGGYRPKLTVRFAEGMPRGVPVKVSARFVRGVRPHAGETGVGAAPSDEPQWEIQAGEVPIDASGPGELVVGLPQIATVELAKIEDSDWAFDVNVGGRALKPGFYPRRAVREAVGRAERALATLSADTSWLRPGSFESVTHIHDHLVKLVGKGDADVDALATEAHELDSLAASLEQQADPYAMRVGPMRRALRSPTDGELSEFGLYVPAKYTPGATDQKFPLVVGLHGMNGNGMSMLRWVFGYDDPGHDSEWENRHTPQQLPTFNAFVITPDAFGNAMYRDMGEDDVMRVVEWAKKNFPIDPQRVSITGPSMGGIGAAAIPFHHPGVFSATAPLCGYHSYFIRRDYGGRPVRPWERLIAEERSNTSWAYNAFRMPVWIVHGKKDLPEANSGVLIERLQNLGYGVKHDHPDLGHNVWQETYQGLKGASWLTWHKKELHPKTVRLRTIRPRFSDNLWVHIEQLAAPDQWGEVHARVRSRTEIELVTARGIAELKLDRDPELLDVDQPITVSVDGARVIASEAGPVFLHKEGAAWKAGPATHAGQYKHGESSGPIRDIFHSPLLFVYGTDDPAQARMNEEVARSWARVRWGVTAKFPVMSDAEFLAKNEPIGNDRALFLVGNAKSNRIVRALEPDFPIKVDGNAIVIGAQRITGNQVGAAFIRPNPRRPDRYVVVVEGVDAAGTWRSTSLPDLLPDFLVYDEQVAPARGQQLLSAGLARAGGFFQNDWSLPANTADPSARAERPAARSEYDATPYLP